MAHGVPAMRCATGALAFLAVTTLVVRASAEDADTTRPGFGTRGATVFTVENVLGLASLNLGKSGESASVTEKGFLAPYAAQVGLFGVSPSGFGGGVALGFVHLAPSGNDALNFAVLRPRITYSAAQSSMIALWLRLGPSLYVLNVSDTSVYSFDVGGEALLVITPVRHVGIMMGLTAEVGLAAKDDQKLAFGGFTSGLLLDF